jgi:hypothetical protein
VKELVDEHKSTFDENHLRDFIDVYLKEMQSGQDPDFNGNKYILNYIPVPKAFSKLQQTGTYCLFE